MFSADLFPVAMENADESDPHETDPVTLLPQLRYSDAHLAISERNAETDTREAVRDNTPVSDETSFGNEIGTALNDAGFELAPATELIFIDYRTPDVQTLLDDIEHNSTEEVTFEVVLIDSDTNGIDLITSTVEKFDNIAAIHIVSHGTDGSVRLGAQVLSNDTLEEHSQSIGQWQQYLAHDADILIYGCEVAETHEGQLFVDQIGELTGADVAASDDLTGHADLGGNWQFEYIVGQIETELAFSMDVQHNWFGTLANVTVTTPLDVVDGTTTSIVALIADPGADNAISLREAIIAANNSPGADVILLDSGTYTLSMAGNGDTLGDLNITSPVEIIGVPDGSSVISAEPVLNDRVFTVESDATFQHLTITGGDANSGGGINNNSTLTVDNSVVTGNKALFGGGGILNNGTLIVSDSTISSNTAGNNGGGGISSVSGQIELDSVTIYDNHATGSGGGVYLVNGSHDLVNVTVSGNIGPQGGIHIDNGAEANLDNVTITGNTGALSGGIFNLGGIANVTESIISDNFVTGTSANPNVFGTVNSDMFSIITDDPGLQLEPLADNGGAVHTHALMSGSSAINPDPMTMATPGETDARGYFVADPIRDLGAFEFGATATAGPTLDLSSGIEINADGGNDTYLLADDGAAIFGGATAFTIEMSFSGQASASGTPLISYAAGDPNGNDVYVSIQANGNLFLFVDGTLASSSSMDYNNLLKGEKHSIAVSWDNTLGAWAFYVDGKLTDSGFGLKQGSTVAGSTGTGELVFGNDQDSIGGGFESNQSFEGTFYDVRVWDGVRNQSEIELNYKQKYDPDNFPVDLIANWQFDGLNSGNIVDIVSDNNLTVAQASGTGFIASTAVDALNVDENSINGSTVGYVIPSDSPATATVSDILAMDPALRYDETTKKFYKPVAGDYRWVDANLAASTETLNGVTGQLVTIQSQYENDLVQDIASALATPDDVWIGASDQNSEGNWYWYADGVQDNSELFWQGNSSGSAQNGQYTNWLANPAEPTAGGATEDFARLAYQSGAWRDTGHTINTYSYVVEWDASEVTGNPQFMLIDNAGGRFNIDSATGRITVADGSLLDYEASPSHTVTVEITDADGNTYAEDFTVTVNNVNDAPVLSAIEAAPASYTEHDIPLIITGSTAVSDVDDANIESAVVSISGNFTTDDVLNFTDQNNITGNYDTSNGILTLTGSASLADYQTALRSITFENTGDNPSDQTRTVSFLIYDGDNNSNSISRDINTTALNDAPTLATIEAAPALYIEDGSPVGITGNLSLDDLDDDNIESATVSISNNFAADDELVFTPQSGITGLFNSATGILTLTGSASVADYQAALTTVAYKNNSNNPSTFTRTVSFEINDGDLSSNILSRDINFTAVNDAPTLATIEAMPAMYTESDSPVGITGNLLLDDPDDVNIESAVVSISNNFAAGEDQLIFTDQSGITGSFNGTTGILTLTGSATVADYQTALTTVAYNNTSNNPSSLTRTVSFEINDGDLNSNELSRNIEITAINDAPVLSAIEAAPASYSENDIPLIVTAGTAVSDIDDANVESAVVSISGNFTTDDVLNFTDQNGITGNYDTANGILTLTGSASLTDYQTALRSITFENTSDDPSDLTRTVSFLINDGDDDSNILSRDINFTAVNDAPTLATIEAMPALYIQRGSPVGITGNLSLDDVDDVNIETATVSISSNFSAGDVLIFIDQPGISGSYDDTTGILTLTGSASVADFQTALTTIAYNNTSDNPSPLTRTISFVINDGESDSNMRSRDIEFIPVVALDITAPQSIMTDEDVQFEFTGPDTISVDDGVADDTLLQVTLSVANGGLTLGDLTEIEFIEGSNGDGTIVIEGLESEINAALLDLTYRPDPDYNEVDTLHITTATSAKLAGHYTFDIGSATATTINDVSAGSPQNGELGGNTKITNDPDRGAVLSLDGDNEGVDIVGVFDEPTNVTLAAWVNLTSADRDGADVISLGNNIQLQLDTKNGLQGAYFNGKNFQRTFFPVTLAGTGWHHVAFTFDQDSRQQVLYLDGIAVEYTNNKSSIAYENSPDTTIGHHGDGSLHYDFDGLIDDARIYTRALSEAEIAALATDQTTTTTATQISIAPINDAPRLSTIEALPAMYSEGDSPLVVTGNLSVADVDDTIIESATVSISNNFAAGEDELIFSDQSGIAGSFNAATGILTLTGSASVADYQTALTTVAYNNTSDNPSAMTRTVSFEINDGDLNSNVLSRNINFTAVNDAPVLSAIETAPASYTENDTPLIVTGSTAVSDVDDTNIESAIVSISGNFTTDDVLNFTDQNGITGNYDTANGILTLTGSASLTNYQTALRSISYENTGDDPSDLTRTVSFLINDGDDDSNILSRDINFTAVNDAPTLATIEAMPALYTEGGSPVSITGNISLDDLDDVNIESAVVSISNNFAAGEDELIFTDQSGITGSFNAATGILTLTGSASVADYHTALTTVAYNNTSDNPSALTRTVSFEINDGDLNSNVLSRNINFTAVNDAPVLSAIETAPASYTENDIPLIVTDNTAVSDIDDVNIESAIVSIRGNFTTDDVLNFTDQNGITGSYDSVNGILTLTGSASLADYQTALRSISYENTSDDPSDLTRTVSFLINDGDDVSNILSRDINFTAVNDAPTLATIEAMPALYTEGGSPVSITGSLSLDDIDDVNIESATVTISGNFTANDVLNFTDQNGIISNYDTVNGILTLSGSASLADYQAALQSITYDNTSDNPSDLTRTVSFQINDGEVNSNTVSRDINFTAVNDAPTLSSIEAMPAFYTEGSSAVGITANLSIEDLDDINIESASISISNNFAAGEDELVFTDQSGITGSFNAATGILTLTGSASIADYQAALTSVAFNNTSNNPSALTRTVSFEINDGDLSSNILSRDIELIAVNDAPILSVIETLPLSYSENDSPLILTAATSVSDVDDTNIESAVISISGNFTTDDVLSFADQNGITGNYNTRTGTLSLTGSASLADYQSALQSITYENTSEDPSNLTRTVSFQIDDGDNVSNTVVRNINFTAVNDAPVLSTIEALPAIYIENAPPLKITGNLQLTDVDNINIESASITISANYAAGEDELLFTDQAGISGSWDTANGVLTLTGSATVTDYENALRSVEYFNSSDDPSALSRTIAFSVSDGEKTSNIVSRGIELTAINDNPITETLENEPLVYVENQAPIAITNSLTISDIDSTFLENAEVSISSNYFADQDRLLFSNTVNIVGQFDINSGVLSLSGTASLAEYQQAIRSITYQNINDNPSSLTRNVEITISDQESQSVSVSRNLQVQTVNDAPAATDKLIGSFEDTDYVLSTADFGFTDVLDQNNFAGIVIQNSPSLGTLTLNGDEVIAGQFIEAEDIAAGRLAFTPQADANGIDYDNFEFRVVDDGGTELNGVDTSLSSNIISFNVSNVNDAPGGTDTTITTLEDTIYLFTREDFGFTDPLDDDQFQAITIGALPESGTLLLDGIAVDAGTVVEIDLIDAGLLQYTPAINQQGSGYKGLSFQVHDDGGNSNGGQSIDQTDNFITFDIPGVNDSPLLITETTSVDEGSENTLTTEVLTAIDSDDALPEELTFAINSLPTNGTLTLNGNPVATGSEFTLSELQQDQLIYTHDGSETSSDFFDIQVSDGGENGSIPATGRFTLLINEVIDPPPLITDESIDIQFAGMFDSQQGSQLNSGEFTLAADSLNENPRLIVEVESQPTSGMVTIEQDGSLTYTHDGGRVLQDSFQYRVTNEDGVFSVATVTVSIDPQLASALPTPNPVLPTVQEVEPEQELEQIAVVTETRQEENAQEVEESATTEESQESDQPEDPDEENADQANFDLTQDSVAFVVNTDDLLASEGALQTRGIQSFDFNRADSLSSSVDGLQALGVRSHNIVEFTDIGNDITGTINTTSFNIVTEVETRRAYDVVSSRQFIKGLDQLDLDFQKSEEENKARYRLATDSTIGVSLSATAGILAWVLRGGALFASAMAYTPIWSSIDPVRVTGATQGDRKSVDDTDSEVEKYFS